MLRGGSHLAQLPNVDIRMAVSGSSGRNIRAASKASLQSAGQSVSLRTDTSIDVVKYIGSLALYNEAECSVFFPKLIEWHLQFITGEITVNENHCLQLCVYVSFTHP